MKFSSLPWSLCGYVLCLVMDDGIFYWGCPLFAGLLAANIAKSVVKQEPRKAGSP